VNGREARPALIAALDRTGRLTASQAARLLEAEPRHASRWLQQLVRDGLAIQYQEAWWSPRCPRTLPAHRHLVTEAYVRLIHHPACRGWEPEPSQVDARPDALVLWALPADGRALRLALEADTGTERHSQWRTKLARYAVSPPDGILIVTPRSRRGAHLANLAEGTAAPVLAVVIEDLPDALVAWAENVAPAAAAFREPPPAEPTRRLLCYCVGDKALQSGLAEAGLMQGTWVPGALERRAGTDIQHLVPVRVPRRPR
jgi:hypothetical protein